MTPADELRAAATKLRALVQAATPGPWCFYGDDLWHGSVAALEAFDTGPDDTPWPYGDDEAGHLFYGDPVRPEDAAFIAAMDPGVALALADWFDDEAVGAQTETGEPTAHSLVVARAINGGGP